jgi:hypothetical protein
MVRSGTTQGENQNHDDEDQHESSYTDVHISLQARRTFRPASTTPTRAAAVLEARGSVHCAAEGRT